jgi:hypothetical protein
MLICTRNFKKTNPLKDIYIFCLSLKQASLRDFRTSVYKLYTFKESAPVKDTYIVRENQFMYSKKRDGAKTKLVTEINKYKRSDATWSVCRPVLPLEEEEVRLAGDHVVWGRFHETVSAKIYRQNWNC